MLLDEKNEMKFYTDYIQPWAKFLLNVELTGVALNEDKITDLKQHLELEEQELRYQLDQLWDKAHSKYYQIQERELSEQYREMALQKISKTKNLDSEKLRKIEHRYNELYKKALQKIEKRLNYESPKQMLWLLKDYLQLPVLNFKEEESTGVEVLEKLAATGREDMKLFLKWRGVQKLLGAFIPSYEALAMKGVIHPSFHLSGTRTGRLSCSDPNLQQIPSDLYCMFKPRKGNVFVGFDMEAIEAKLIAAYANDLNLFDIISKGYSIHDYNAKNFFALEADIKDVKRLFPSQRQAAKTVGFALFYGAGRNRIKAALTSAGFSISDAEASHKHENFKEYFEDAVRFHREITKAFEKGEVIQNVLGRPISIEDPSDAYMKGFNKLIQSSASDLCLNGAYLAQQEYDTLDLDANVIMLIHDFVLVEVAEDVAEQAAQILKKHMTRKILKTDFGDIPLTVSGGVMGNEWKK
jgi:DNA polymerase-1